MNQRSENRSTRELNKFTACGSEVKNEALAERRRPRGSGNLVETPRHHVPKRKWLQFYFGKKRNKHQDPDTKEPAGTVNQKSAPTVNRTRRMNALFAVRYVRSWAGYGTLAV